MRPAILSLSAISALSLSAILSLSACDSTPSQAASALELPIDFAWGCEGDGQTQTSENDETAASINDTRMCPDVNGAQGELFGVALDRQPAGLVVLQLNPAAGDRGFIDADFFRPGTSSIPVGEQPIQVLAATDHSAFFVLSAGDQRVDRVVIEGHDADGLHYTSSIIPLPGAPAGGIIIGDTLVIAARDTTELWLVPTTGEQSPLVTTVAVTAHVNELVLIPGATDEVLVTFRDRKTVARLGLDGEIRAEAGVVAACRDGLDNDGDGQADKADPDCQNFDDDDESTATGDTRVVGPINFPEPHAGDPCADEIDNDDDGFTDEDDDACRAGNAETTPECDDGIDNDGDGKVDDGTIEIGTSGKFYEADETCYGKLGSVEGQAPDDGPFHPTIVDAGAIGRFVYVLDERIGQVLAFDLGADGTFTRIDVNATQGTIPTLRSVDFDDPSGEVEENAPVPLVRPPALARRGVKNIEVLEGNAFSLSSSRLRGEVWDRIIEPDAETGRPTVSFTPNSAEWKPGRCAPENTAACEQPAHDDETWFLFGANLSGRIQMIEAIRRGVPAHRLAQRELDLGNRTLTITSPRLTLRGRLINARGEPQSGLPFIGAAIEEELVAEVDDVSPAKLRRFGVWPPENLEEAPTESWALTFEGRIPGTSSDHGGFVVNEDVENPTLIDPEATFCEDGVEVGDWVQLTVPIASVDPALVKPLTVVTANGVECPTVVAKTAIVEARVSKVGMSRLEVDPSTARLRPTLPVLDLVEIENGKVSRRACEQAIDDLDDTLGNPENLTATNAFSPENLPQTFAYSVRVADQWTLVGTRSGFLHRWRWDRDSETCVEDTSLDARLKGRVGQRPDAVVGEYAACPPPADQLSKDNVEDLAPAAERFFNPSLGVDVFPACQRDAEGDIEVAPSQQDTTFSFDLTGPQQGSALAISNSVLTTRVPMLDFRRQQVQLDASARRATILQMRVADPKVIATFE